jgi:hypothetical protein
LFLADCLRSPIVFSALATIGPQLWLKQLGCAVLFVNNRVITKQHRPIETIRKQLRSKQDPLIVPAVGCNNQNCAAAV